jgi:hypothetical protein
MKLLRAFMKRKNLLPVLIMVSVIVVMGTVIYAAKRNVDDGSDNKSDTLLMIVNNLLN